MALEYPKLAGKFGKFVTYADDKTSHMKVEFSFDAAEVAKGNYAPQAYHDFIGFEVEKGVLERAFRAPIPLNLRTSSAISISRWAPTGARSAR